MATEEHHDHAIPFKFLIRTFLTLLFLTTATVVAAMFDFASLNPLFAEIGLEIDFTPLNIILAMMIAFTKATLVAVFFMGLKFDKKMNVAILVGNMVFVFIFFVITLTDTEFRQEIDPLEGLKLEFDSPVLKNYQGADHLPNEADKNEHH